MSIPIVLTAFGTTTRAREAYQRIDSQVRAAFPANPLHWAYSSRMVGSTVKQREGRHLTQPGELLTHLARQGHTWVVVQSLHLMCGHEFWRLTETAREAPVRTAMGLPLLCSPEDYHQTVSVLATVYPPDEKEALLLVGHGTDHPAWTAYVALQQMCRERMGPRVYVGVVEGDYPDRDALVARIAADGYRRVRLVPFMLVAGMHFFEDLCGPEDSWKTALEEKDLTVAVDERALSGHAALMTLFCRHIRDALAVIPECERDPRGCMLRKYE